MTSTPAGFGGAVCSRIPGRSRGPRRLADGPGPGFTLIELLVVVAVVIAILAMLLPAWSKVRAVANTATCANNLRQIGLGTGAYNVDYRGALVPAGWGVPGDFHLWFDPMLGYGVPGLRSSPFTSYVSGERALPFGATSASLCPSHPGAMLYWNEGSYTMSQYTAWGKLIWGQSGDRWPKLHRLLRPAGSIYMADNMRINPVPIDYGYMNMGAFYTFIETGMSNSRHVRGANFLYFDGHVQLLAKADQAGSPAFKLAVHLRGQF